MTEHDQQRVQVNTSLDRRPNHWATDGDASRLVFQGERSLDKRPTGILS